jgi:xanthosine utilization system XapX-like protein
MSLYFSYKHLPELAQFNPRQKRIVWLNFVEEECAAGHTLRSSRLLGGLFIAGFLLGIVVGAMTMRSPEVGGLVGGLVGIVGVSLGLQPCLLHASRKPLCDYIASESFSLVPINKRARMFLDPLRRHDA